MIVGYAVLYEDGELVISKEHTVLQKKIERDYGQFEERNVLWKNDNEKIKTVRILNQVKSNYMNAWFENCVNLTTLLDFQNLDVSDCKNFAGVFLNCMSLINISSLKNWNVSSGKTFAWMFSFCLSLRDISSLSNWNVFKGKYFSYMFGHCESLLDITSFDSWNISYNVDVEGMFENCINLKEIYLSHTLKKLNLDMFEDCNSNLRIHWKDKIYTYDDLLEYQEF